MADIQPPPAAFNTDKPAAQSKDAAGTTMGYPITAAPTTPPSPVPSKRPRAWLLGTAIALALVCLGAQAAFMNSRLRLYYYPADYNTPSGSGSSSGSGSGSGSAGSGSGSGSGYNDAMAELQGHNEALIDMGSIGTRKLASLVPKLPVTSRKLAPVTVSAEPPAISRKLLGSKKKSKSKSKAGSGGDNDDDDDKYAGMDYYDVKGKQVAKAPGMVIATAVIALVAAIVLTVLLCVPRLHGFGTSKWSVLAQAVAIFVILVLWLASMGCSAKTASYLNKDGVKDLAPTVWKACNAVALVCALLGLFVWGALLAFAIKALMPVVKSWKGSLGGHAAAEAAAAHPAKDAAAAPMGAAPVAHNAAYAAAAPPAGVHVVQDPAYAAAAPAVYNAEYPAPHAGAPAAGVHNPAYAAAPAGASAGSYTAAAPAGPPTGAPAAPYGAPAPY